MLKQVSDPRTRDIELTPNNDSDEITTKSGWHVKSFLGDDGEIYERAQRSGTIKWYLVD